MNKIIWTPVTANVILQDDRKIDLAPLIIFVTKEAFFVLKHLLIALY